MESLLVIWSIIQVATSYSTTRNISSVLDIIAISWMIASICILPIWAIGSSTAAVKMLKYLWTRQQSFFGYLGEFGIKFEIHGTPTRPEFLDISPKIIEFSNRHVEEIQRFLETYPDIHIDDTTPLPSQIGVTYLHLIAIAKYLSHIARRLCQIYALGIVTGTGILIFYWSLLDSYLASVLGIPFNLNGFLIGVSVTIFFICSYIYESKWLLFVQIPLGYDLTEKIKEISHPGRYS